MTWVGGSSVRQRLRFRRLFPLGRSLCLPAGRLVTRETALDPSVDLRGQKLPELAHLVRGHALPGDPLVDRVRIDPEMRRDLVHG